MSNAVQDTLTTLRGRLGGEGGATDRKFGTFGGVFVPTVLTILGVIMYLRLAWVVGNAGVVGAILIILLAHVVTISTGLAVSSIATNIRVGAGGAFSIISQSLGLEVGGSVSVPLYLAQAISVAMYVFGFTEGVLSIFPDASEPAVLFGTFAAVFAISYASSQLASRVQFIILAVVGLSLFSIVMGSFPIGQQEGLVYTPELIGDFSAAGFWEVFAVFFPAVTGIMVGLSLSGALKNPRRSIPVGTLSGIAVTLVIYLLLIYWLGRVATPEELIDTDPSNIVMVNKALWGWAVLAGLLGATFSSALGSMIAAPRVVAALGEHEVVPRGGFFAKMTAEGEPRNSLIVTGIIAFFTLVFGLLSGGLNAIAPLITMFFLLTYGALNAVVLIEQILGMVSFRPTFKVPWAVPLVGLVSCVVVMFLINPAFGLGAVVFTLFIYGYLLRKQLRAPWGDVRSGLFMAVAEWAGERVSRMPEATERTWTPNILAPVNSTKMMTASYRFLRSIAAPQGTVRALGLYPPGRFEDVVDLDELTQAFIADGIYARTTLLETDDFVHGVQSAAEVLSSVFFRPNILFMLIFAGEQERDMAAILRKTESNNMGVVLLARQPIVELGREQHINVWVREQEPDWELSMRLSNLDLSVLLAYQLSRNWHGDINLCMAVEDEQMARRAEIFLSELVTLARLPNRTRITVVQDTFWNALEKTPSADINFFGLPRQFKPDFLRRVFEQVDASCLFIRDSGNESALA
ncbi:MAG: amino acid permease [Candidatus Promineifilaceae bacterium]|nr:amino acid permease [Candidatus Promineifilaceae bacterium]